MTELKRIFRHAASLACALTTALAPASNAVETLTVEAEVVGTTPVSLGYNLGHFLENSNAADWFRYSEVDSARMFISVSDLEPNDDLPPVGDGVTDKNSFFARLALLRANAADSAVPLSTSYVDWNYFVSNLAKLSTGNNRFRYSHVLATLRDAGVDVLANLTAAPGRFPLVDSDDWAGRCELWQHYYAVAFLMSRDFNVRRYSIYNEPNLSPLNEAEWLERLRVCSDAIQAAISDMNARYGRSLLPEIFAPTTANGAEKYHSPGSDVWGSTAVRNRHLRLDGTSDPAWMNLHVYSYQKYTTRQTAEGGFSGFLTDYDELRGLIDADMSGEPTLPLALTEANVRTGANFDTVTATLDSTAEFSSLGASLVGLAGRGIDRIYLFKFAQTSSDSFYGVAKNGTHYCQNSSGTLHQYGGATAAAEVYRLFLKAARGARPIHRVTASAGASPGANSGLWSLATHDKSGRVRHLFLANRDNAVIPLDIDFSALGIPPGNPFFIEQVSATRVGGVVRRGELAAGKTGTLNLPARAVWLVTVPERAATVSTQNAVADTQIGDGTSAATPGGALDTLVVRADGTVDGRRVALIRLPVPAAGEPGTRRVLLEMDVASEISGSSARAHVYGIENNDWSEGSFTWQQAAAFLKSGVPAGSQIENNVVTGHGGAARMLGQLASSAVTMTRLGIDVTDFATSRTDGVASFLIVQEHRWDVAQPSLDVGDIQAAGLRIRSRENSSGTPPRLVTILTLPAPVIGIHPQAATLLEGSPLVIEVEASGSGPLDFQWRRNGVALAGQTGAMLEIPAAGTADTGDYDVVVSSPFGTITSQAARVLVYVPGIAQVTGEATVRGGPFADLDVDEAADGYLLIKHLNDLSFARKSYFQFDLPPDIADMDAPATFTLYFQNTFSHQVRLWSLSGFDGPLERTMTWNQAPANSTGDNEMLTTGTPAATLRADSTRIAPGSALTPYSFNFPRLGDVLENNRVTLVLSGVDDDRNHSGGLRVARESVTLDYQVLSQPSPWRDWQVARFGSEADNPLISGLAADPDLDGITNLLEYVLGGDPNGPDLSVLPVIESTGLEIEIRFPRNPAATDVELACQRASSPGGQWSDIALSGTNGMMGSLVPEVETSERELPDGRIEVTIGIFPPHPTSGFFRLRAHLGGD